MGQLLNTCGGISSTPLRTLPEVHQTFFDTLTAIVDTTMVSVYECFGYVLACDIVSQVHVPAFDNSAVDGYAVRLETVSNCSDLSVVGRLTAGADFLQSFDTLGCVRIFTGAGVPAGFDTVYMQEDVTVNKDGTVTFPHGQKVGANIRRMSEDITKGSVILSRGKKLTPSDVALIASQGMATVTVYKKLRVGFFSSGDELLEVGGDSVRLSRGMVFDSNRPMMLSLLVQMGFEPVDLGRADDTLDSVRSIIQKGCDTCDCILSAGGMSVGEEDHIQKVLQAHEVAFWRVAIKPGRPVGFGHCL